MKNKTILIIAAVLVIGGGVAWASGVFNQKVAENIIEDTIESQTNGNADVDISGDSVNINVNGSSMQLGSDVELPAEFPNDVYVPSNATINGVVNTLEDAYTVTMESDDTVAALQTEYESEMTADGWTKTLTSTTEAGAVLIWSKDERVTSVNLTNNDDGTTGIGLSVGPAA